MNTEPEMRSAALNKAIMYVDDKNPYLYQTNQDVKTERIKKQEKDFQNKFVGINFWKIRRDNPKLKNIKHLIESQKSKTDTRLSSLQCENEE